MGTKEPANNAAQRWEPCCLDAKVIGAKGSHVNGSKCLHLSSNPYLGETGGLLRAPVTTQAGSSGRGSVYQPRPVDVSCCLWPKTTSLSISKSCSDPCHLPAAAAGFLLDRLHLPSSFCRAAEQRCPSLGVTLAGLSHYIALGLPVLGRASLPWSKSSSIPCPANHVSIKIRGCLYTRVGCSIESRFN